MTGEIEALPYVDVSALTSVTVDTRGLSRIYLEPLEDAPGGLFRPVCGASGGITVGAGHECRCNRRASHGPWTSGRGRTGGHGCECGAFW